MRIEGEPDYPDFLRAWQELPKRAGSDSKRNAFVKWRARIKEGVDPQEIIDGAKRYATYCDARGLTGGEYVMRGETFFGTGAHWENEWAA